MISTKCEKPEFVVKTTYFMNIFVQILRFYILYIDSKNAVGAFNFERILSKRAQELIV